MPTQKPRISFIADEELRSELEAWADEEFRSLSNLAEAIVREAVAKRQSQSKRKAMAQALETIKKILTSNAPEDEELQAAIAALEKGLTD